MNKKMQALGGQKYMESKFQHPTPNGERVLLRILFQVEVFAECHEVLNDLHRWLWIYHEQWEASQEEKERHSQKSVFTYDPAPNGGILLANYVCE
jgi:hypothetical protein